jgi:hypothetical protein
LFWLTHLWPSPFTLNFKCSIYTPLPSSPLFPITHYFLPISLINMAANMASSAGSGLRQSFNPIDIAQVRIMDSLTTHPSTAQQAKAFTSPASLSYPGGAGDLTPPSSEKDGQNMSGKMNGLQLGADAAQNGNGVTPATPAATPGAGQGSSGIVPTLQ